MKNKFYTYDGSIYFEDSKNKQFVNLRDNSKNLPFSTDASEFKQIVEGQSSKSRNSTDEKLFRILADITTIVFFTEDTIENLNKKVSSYLSDIEDYERLALLRDIIFYYHDQKSKKKQEVFNYLNKENNSEKL